MCSSDLLDLENWTALHVAALKGNLEICQILVSKGAIIDTLDSDNWTALFYAMTMNQLHVIKYLLEKGANPNAKNHKCVSNNLVLSSGNELNTCDFNGSFPPLKAWFSSYPKD